MRCAVSASHRYTLPGKDEARVCLIHATQLQKLADALGLHLQMIPLSMEEMLEDHQCHQNIREDTDGNKIKIS